MTYELIDQATSNSLAAFEREDDALDAFRQIAAEDPEGADALLLVLFNDAGEAVQALPARQRVSQVA